MHIECLIPGGNGLNISNLISNDILIVLNCRDNTHEMLYNIVIALGKL